VGILAGHGEPLISTSLTTVHEQMQKHNSVRTVAIDYGSLIDDDITTLAVIGPVDSLDRFELYALDQFIMRGGRIGWFLDGVRADPSAQMADTSNTNLDEFLLNYGIKVHKDLVIDARNSRITVLQRQGQIQYQSYVEYPFIPEVANFNRENIIVKGIGAVNLPFVSTIDTTLAEQMGLLMTPIAYSSERAGRRTSPFNIQPMQRFTITDFPLAHLPLAATVIGSYSSYFNNQPIPDSGVTELPEHIARSPITRMVIVGDSEFMQNQSARNPENAALFLNMIDWLSQDDGLVSIRARATTSRPLDPTISDGERWRYKYFNILGPAFIVVIFGLVRWRMRRAHRRVLVAQYRHMSQDGGTP